MASAFALSARPLPSTSAASKLKTWQPWYDTIIDWFLTNPGGKINECARDLRKTPQWIGQLIRNDFFRHRLSERRAEFNADLGRAVDQKLSEVALASLDLLLDRMDRSKAAMRTPELISIADKSLTALGYGAASPSTPGAPVNVQINVSPEGLKRARANLRRVEGNILEVADDE